MLLVLITLSVYVPLILAQTTDQYSAFEQLPQFTRFRHFGVEQGLSNGTAWHLIKDQRGYIWIATFDGLNRFDGYGFTVFKHDPENPNSLSSSFIKHLFEDNEGFLWVGTSNGFNKYNPETEQFTQYLFDTDVSEKTANVIFEDSKGRLWIGSWHGVLYRFDRSTEKLITYQPDTDETRLGRMFRFVEDKDGMLWIACDGNLSRFDPETQTFKSYIHDPDNTNSLSHNKVIDIKIDQDGIFWLATVGGGINRFDPKTEQFTHFRHDPTDPASLSSDAIMVLEEDSPGVFWAGTFGGGLNQFDTKTGTSIRYQSNSLPYALNDNRIPSLFKDDRGSLWIGTFGGGMNMYNRFNSKFAIYQHINGNKHSLSHNEVWAIAQDHDDNYWIGTLDGLDKYDPKKKTFSHFTHTPDNPNSISSNQIQDILIDSQGIIWIATWKSGISRFDPKTELFTQYPPDPDNPAPLSELQDIEQDKSGNLWFGSFGGGLTLFDPKTKRFTHFQHAPDNPHSLSSRIILSLYADSSNVLWIGTNIGLNSYDAQAGSFKRYEDHASAGHQVYTIYESKAGSLWIGTNYGLHTFNRKDNTQETFTVKDGLPSEMIAGILEDDQGKLWISTGKGISAFDPLTKTFRNYDRDSGLQKKEFVANSVYKASDGQMFFGGRGGMNAFYPEEMTNNPYPPPVTLTEFKIFNEPVKINDSSPLKKVIALTSDITLPYTQNVFSFGFAALDHVSADKNQYAYLLEGFDKNWVFTDAHNRQAKYTNLDAGTYTFKVKASNSDGVWNEESTSLKITIQSAWWETWWSKSLIALFVAGLLYGISNWRVKTIETQKRELAIKVAMRTEALRESNKQLHIEIVQRKKIEEELHKNKSLLDATGQMARVGGWELDAETLEVTWTEETYRIHEVPLDCKPPLGETINFYHPDDQIRLTQVLQRALEHGDPYDIEVRLITAKGNHLWTRSICQPEIVNGKTVKLRGAFQDITEQKRAEEEREKLVSDLQQAVQEIKTLEGIVPICSYCKNIRDDKGYWNRLESYIETHSDASFSHSICPDCEEKYFGEEEWYKTS